MATVTQVTMIVISIILVILIMLQVKGDALGNLIGGDAGGGISRTRRGLEKTIFRVTVFLCIAFMGVSLFSVVANQ